MKDARARLKIPAIVIMALSVIDIVTYFGFLMWLRDVPGLRHESLIMISIQALLIFFMCLNIFCFYGALQMLKLRKYRFAMTSAVIAAFKILSGLPIGIPFGIWALVLLLKPEIKEEFDHAN